jgi:N-methylhydantoinase B/oxoprolinase/acetone carboxylase alpha subunit
MWSRRRHPDERSYHGGSHLPDITAFVPVFDEGKRLFWTVVRAHQSDIGGSTHGAYNPDARDIWTEGLRIPPVRLYEAGKLRDDLVDLLALNTRIGHDFRGDLAAMVGAARLGESRMAKLFAEFGGRLSSRRSRASSTLRRRAAAPSSRPGRTASSKGRRSSTTTDMAARTSASRRVSRSAAATSRSTCPSPIRRPRAS